MRKTRKIKTLDEFIREANQIVSKQTGIETKETRADVLKQKYRESLKAARGNNQEAPFGVRTGYYSLRTRIIKNPWLKNAPYSKALKWLYSEVFKNPNTYRYNKILLQQGHLFIFEYKNPKYKGTSVLPWFDKYPLVLSLGPRVTSLGLRNIGINLHLLPPKIRIIVLCKVFDLYKRFYRYQIFLKIEQPVQIDYTTIVKRLEFVGVKFAIRMYIPQRQHQIVHFPYKSWYKAIFIPSRGYDGIMAAKLIREWKAYCKTNKLSISENIDWRSVVGS